MNIDPIVGNISESPPAQAGRSRFQEASSVASVAAWTFGQVEVLLLRKKVGRLSLATFLCCASP
jgi:hypothetical protein